MCFKFSYFLIINNMEHPSYLSLWSVYFLWRCCSDLLPFLMLSLLYFEYKNLCSDMHLKILLLSLLVFYFHPLNSVFCWNILTFTKDEHQFFFFFLGWTLLLVVYLKTHHQTKGHIYCLLCLLKKLYNFLYLGLKHFELISVKLVNL